MARPIGVEGCFSDGPVSFPTNAAAIEDRRARRRLSRGMPKAPIPGRQLEAAITMKMSYFETGRYAGRRSVSLPSRRPATANLHTSRHADVVLRTGKVTL